MLAITAPSHIDPSGYQLSTLPRPVVSDPADVLFRVHAASINPVDVKKAAEGCLIVVISRREGDDALHKGMRMHINNMNWKML